MALQNLDTLARIKAQSGFQYERHKPEQTDLYQIIDQYWPTFKAQLSEADINLPAFIHSEFNSYLKCGLLEHGFLRVKCKGCRFEHLVAFSCKRRGFCASCGARRMIETSAHLIDNVIPDVPVRQWVLSFPWPLRMLFARQPQALSNCLSIINRAIETDLIKRAGLARKSGAKGGMVTLIQRFGSALNLNVHLHMLSLDGVYTGGEQGGKGANKQIRFHPVKTPTRKALDTLLEKIIQRLIRKLERDGLLIAEEEYPWLDFGDTEPLDNISAASIRYRIAIGPQSGHRTLTIHNPAMVREQQTTIKYLTTNQNGFSLNAAVAFKPHQRDKLERLCRYVTRPAICLDRLILRQDDQVQYQLKQPFSNGTTHVVFSPLDFISKLVALIPRPRHNLTRYHGALAPNAKIRKHITPAKSKRKPKPKRLDHKADNLGDNTVSSPLTAPLSWAERLKRVFDVDILLCPKCGGRLTIIAEITDPTVIYKVLDHVARAPPKTQPASTNRY